MPHNNEHSKPPRWISTEAGLWAWQAQSEWRTTAANALSVQERVQLLHEAEQLQRTSTAPAGAMLLA